ncbi:MAG: PRC-barrel domain-containing protein [Chloroflexota bacterium]|nr:PRC-barrel domain-containing protein [Chloroflexota bacterium]
MASTDTSALDEVVSAAPTAEDPTLMHTVIALFDDIIDAEHALSALRKSDQPSEQISVILRERVLSDESSIRQQTVLARVVASSALEAVGGWLQGLASLILPDRASYLVAGPIGAVLATIRESRPFRPSGDGKPARDSSRQLALALAAFGFSGEESDYLEQRVVAGSPLIAITSADADTLRIAHGAFSTHTAVHLGLARTESSINRTAARLLLTGPQTGGTVVIADAISPLHRLSESISMALRSIDFRGREVVSTIGEPLGKVSDVLFERRIREDSEANDPPAPAPDIVRYVILSFGGVLRLTRQRVAIPAERVAEVTGSRIVLSVTKRVIQSAPRFDDLSPMSRQDEVRLCTHFDVPQYWLEDHRGGTTPSQQ